MTNQCTVAANCTYTGHLILCVKDQPSSDTQDNKYEQIHSTSPEEDHQLVQERQLTAPQGVAVFFYRGLE